MTNGFARQDAEKREDLSQEDSARLIIDMIHRTVVHYGLWFSEVQHQFGLDKALDIMKTVANNSFAIQINRLAQVLGIEMKNGIPKPLLEMSREETVLLMRSLSVNWLANDGVWFQAVESSRDMNDAKRCNDTCWSRFSPFEAWSIKEFLGLPEKAGLGGLKKALQFRMYTPINVQTIIDESANSIVFQMNDCRVQNARKRRGLQDYPCKSGGLVEYRAFGETIDSRIRCECIGCPPDDHPSEWFCAWRFSIPDGT